MRFHTRRLSLAFACQVDAVCPGSAKSQLHCALTADGADGADGELASGAALYPYPSSR